MDKKPGMISHAPLKFHGMLGTKLTLWGQLGY